MRDSNYLLMMLTAAVVVGLWGPPGLTQDARYITTVIIATAYFLCHQAEVASRRA